MSSFRSRWFRRYGRPVALIVVGALWFAGFCVWLVSNHGMPEIRLPISTPYTRAGLAAGVLLAVIGLWLLLRVVRGSRRRRQSKRPRAAGGGEARDEAAVPAHGGAGAAATPSRARLEGAGGYQTAGSTWPPGWSRPEDQTIPFPSPAVPGGGQWDGRQVHPPGHVGRPTTDVRSSRAGVRVERMVPASARGGVEAGTPELPPSCLERGARRWAVVGADEGPAPTTFQTPGGGPGTAVRPQTWAAGERDRNPFPGLEEINNHH